MARTTHLILIGALATTALSACTTDSRRSFLNEAGTFQGDGTFGNATMNNTLVQNGEKHYVLDLANRFANEVDSTVNFAFNSSQLDAAARATLNQQANFIRQFPEVRFRVYGHTDLVGSAAYNQRLGLARARAVVGYLVSHGISATRLEAVVSKGETQPLVVTQGRERKNRRTVTEVTGFVEDNPMILDGKYAQVVYRGYVESAIAPTGLTGVDFAGGSSGGE